MIFETRWFKLSRGTHIYVSDIIRDIIVLRTYATMITRGAIMITHCQMKCVLRPASLRSTLQLTLIAVLFIGKCFITASDHLAPICRGISTLGIRTYQFFQPFFGFLLFAACVLFSVLNNARWGLCEIVWGNLFRIPVAIRKSASKWVFQTERVRHYTWASGQKIVCDAWCIWDFPHSHFLCFQCFDLLR